MTATFLLATVQEDVAGYIRTLTYVYVLLIIAYLVILGAFGMLAELILSFGWWKMLARGSSISNPDSLRTVQATAEDKALIGQGLADALNVGAY